MPLGAWCARHKDTIAAFGVIVAAVGFVATGAGLGLTVVQLKTTVRHAAGGECVPNPEGCARTGGQAFQ